MLLLLLPFFPAVASAVDVVFVLIVLFRRLARTHAHTHTYTHTDTGRQTDTHTCVRARLFGKFETRMHLTPSSRGKGQEKVTSSFPH